MAALDLATSDGAATETVAVEEPARRSRRRRSADCDGATEEEKPAAGTKIFYKCRFCLMRFEKSQALGGHMNRHRQEREKEQYQHAQQLVSSMTHQQMPRPWTSLAAGATEVTQVPNALSRQFTGATRSFAPISFSSYQPPSPTSGSNPSVLSSQSPNYYLPSNSSNCNNVQNLHWSVDGFSTAATPPPAPDTGTFHTMETTATSLQTTGVPPEFLAMLRTTASNNDSNILSSSTPSNILSSTTPLARRKVFTTCTQRFHPHSLAECD